MSSFSGTRGNLRNPAQKLHNCATNRQASREPYDFRQFPDVWAFIGQCWLDNYGRFCFRSMSLMHRASLEQTGLGHLCPSQSYIPYIPHKEVLRNITLCTVSTVCMENLLFYYGMYVWYVWYMIYIYESSPGAPQELSWIL